MIKLKSLKEVINEAGKTPLDIKWTKSKEKWDGKFNIDSVVFKIRINKTDYCDNLDVFEFKFTRDGSTKMIKDFRYPYQVVPTIQKAMSDFLTEVKPSVVGFIGNKDDKGRIKMYEKNAKFYSDKFDYKLYIDNSSDYYVFVLYSDNTFEECVKELINSK